MCQLREEEEEGVFVTCGNSLPAPPKTAKVAACRSECAAVSVRSDWRGLDLLIESSCCESARRGPVNLHG